MMKTRTEQHKPLVRDNAGETAPELSETSTQYITGGSSGSRLTFQGAHGQRHQFLETPKQWPSVQLVLRRPASYTWPKIHLR